MTAPVVEDPGAAERRAALREEYVARVNRVLDHVEQHLQDDLSLTALADVAGFSRFHFHRIFTSVMGETPRRFIHRVRVERAAAELVLHPRTPVTRVALECGFSGAAPFARAFQEAFGMSATAWRAGGHRTWEGGGARRATARPARPGLDDRFAVIAEGLDEVSRRPVWWLRFLDAEPVTVTLQRLPPRTIAYLRYVGPYAGDGELFARLFGTLNRWAAPRGLLADENGWWLCVYHDPQVTADERLRVTVGVTVPAGTPTTGEISSMTVDGGTYAVARFHLRATDYSDAWAALTTAWLPESGCELDDRHCFERFPIGADGSDGDAFPVDICLPVRPTERTRPRGG